MSFVFRGGNGARPDLESGLPSFTPERRALRMHATTARPVSSNSLAFLVTALVLFMILNSHQMSPNFMLWLVIGAFLMATTMRMYASCQQLQAQAHAHAAIANGLRGQTELRFHMPQSIALATRGRLHGLRLQLALLNREFDELDYETLRALDSDIVPVDSMSEEEINALPIHKYKVADSETGGSSIQQASPSFSIENTVDSSCMSKPCGNDLTCSVCLEQVVTGEIIRTLPCLHQFHADCIDPWLRQQGTCPVCKFKAGWHDGDQSGVDPSFRV